jgi:quinol monooxygenase YgiN
MIHVVARLEFHEGAREAYLAAFAANAPTVRAEAGCIQYVATTDYTPGLSWQNVNGPNCVMIVERWQSIEALEAHNVTPHMLAIREKTRSLIRDRTISVLVEA